MYVRKSYERYRGMSRPMRQSWLRRRQNCLAFMLAIHPYHINKVDRELERLPLQASGDQ